MHAVLAYECVLDPPPVVWSVCEPLLCDCVTVTYMLGAYLVVVYSL